MLAADTEFILYSLGYGFSQRRISLGNAVLESGGGVVFVYVSGKSSKVVGREGQRGGISGGKADYSRVGERLENLTDSGWLERGKFI